MEAATRDDEICGRLFSYIDLEDRVRADHPLRPSRNHECGLAILVALEELRSMNVPPHAAQDTKIGSSTSRAAVMQTRSRTLEMPPSGRRSAIDERTTRHPGYATSQRIRKRIEEAFARIKTVGGLRQTKPRGLAKVDWAFTFAAAAYDLVRLPKLIEATT
jgi:hypothetical protein